MENAGASVGKKLYFTGIRLGNEYRPNCFSFTETSSTFWALGNFWC